MLGCCLQRIIARLVIVLLIGLIRRGNSNNLAVKHATAGGNHHDHSTHSHHPPHGGSHRLMSHGNPHLVKGLTVHGAIVVSDHFEDINFDHLLNETSNGLVDGDVAPIEDTPGHEEVKKLAARARNYLTLQEQLPFNLTKWSSVVTGPCPHYPNGHKSERGLIWAHYRIWRDFIHFDADVLSSISPDTRPLANNTAPSPSDTVSHSLRGESDYDGDVVASSGDGIYISYRNGTLSKHGTLFREEDVLMIFEDDAMSVIDNTREVIEEEMMDMKVDIAYMGWCEGRTARPVPLCSHAYAITRRGARKLVHYFEPCGRAVDEQFVIMVKNGWLSYRRAHNYNYKTLRKDYNPWGDKTFGIFRQCKSQCGSMNGH